MNKTKSLSIALAALVAAAALATTGCSQEAKTKDGYATSLNLFTWSEYTSQAVLDKFKEEYGIEVKVDSYASNEEMLAKLTAGGTDQYDIIVPSNYYIKAMREQKLIQEIDHKNITNIGNLDEALMNRDFDPGNKYSIPYLLSLTVLVQNSKTSDLNITSYNDLADPALKNNVVVVDDSREMIGIALEALGYDYNDKDEAKLQEAKDWLIKLLPNIKAYDSDSPKTKMLTNETSVGFIWNGEAALAMAENPDIKVIWPKEGASMSIDNFTISAGAKHKREAELYIDFNLRPEISKLISDEFPYTNPNKAALALQSETYLNCPASNVPSEELERANLCTDAGEAAEKFDTIWTEVKAAQ